ncbi:MAG: RNB domain-containing ribonuclease, partial [Oscillospiraceae bacterium]|nr:RNB domain-containing ribonuclease [Oscillospiraceae bacterium]
TRRERDGSLDLDIPESKVILNEDGIAIDIKKYNLSISNQIIEQFMLTANETVAEKFFWLEAPFIYRAHEEPDLDKIKELNKFLYNFGHKVKCKKDTIHPKAFAEVLKAVKGKPEEKVVSNLVLRTLKLARYEAENKGHFGIASKYYCHFTSPIRRYPDLFIHRIISLYLDKKYNIKEEDLYEYEKQAIKYAGTSSDKERIAQKVERDSIDIKKAEYMQDKIGEKHTGTISGITSFGMFVELENTVEGLIRFENMDGDYYTYNEERKTLVGERKKKTFKIGDKIDIEVIGANKESRRIDFAMTKTH